MRSPSFPLSARGILRKGLLNLALAFMAGLLRPATAATIVEYPIPTNGSLPGGITPGPDGNLWFTEGIGNKIGRITPSGQITEFALSSPDSGPSDITTGPDGALWFTEGNNERIGRITTAGMITEFPLPIPGTRPFEIETGPDGALWFTEFTSSRIGRITTGGVVTEFPISSPAFGITRGPDNFLWFTQNTASRVGKISTDGNVTEYPLSPGAAPREITAGPDGNLWVAENTAPGEPGRVGRITTSGALGEFAQNVGSPFGIVTGPDGNLWFSDSDGQTIKRMTPGGEVTTYPVPTPNSSPNILTVGPDGNIWFTEFNGNKIGKLIPTWELKEVAVGQDGRTRQLWVNPNGQMQVKLTDTQGNLLAQSPAFGPFYSPANDPVNGRRWRAKSISVGPDGNSRVVWQRGDEGVEVWIVGPYGNLISKTSGGPF